MRKIIVFLLLFTFLFSNVNKEVLYIEAKLYPKIIMLIKNLQNKKTIKIAILANDSTIESANILKKFINNPKFKIDIIKKVNLDYDVYILTYPLKKKELDALIKNRKVIFAISPDDIQSSMFSIYIGPKVYPYINPYLIKKAKIDIDPILFKVGKIYE